MAISPRYPIGARNVISDEISKNSDESLVGGGGVGQEAAERLLKAFSSVELDSRSKKDACGIISNALDQVLP
jgi:hypothetical protein